jgi:hypothetical protein
VILISKVKDRHGLVREVAMLAHRFLRSKRRSGPFPAGAFFSGPEG